MEEFFNRFLDGIFEIFTMMFSYEPFKVFILLGSVLVFIVFFFQSLSSRSKDR